MDKQKAIKQLTEDLLSKMIGTYEVEVSEADGVHQVLIKTDEEAPTVIGRHGETIRALQKILEVMLYKQFGESVDTVVNVNDYRERQRERLEEMAARSADRVKETTSPSYLRNLSSYERKVVHEYVVAHYPDLSSYSVGEGSDRRLVIAPKGDENQAVDKASEQSE